MRDLYCVITGDEHPFNYKANSSKGPENWGNLNPEWETCETGKLQSPIDLLHQRVEVVSYLGNLRRTYKFAPAVIKNRGHDIMVEWKGNAGGVVINGTLYKLEQCHWHTPSEHTIQGRKFRMELHMVHINSEGQRAVVGILYTLGRPDTFLDHLIGQILSMNGTKINEEELDLGFINPREIKFGSRKYYRYLGSLTVPPCTEGVIWTILMKVRTVSMVQIRALRKAVDDVSTSIN
ncbi:hypothetical protein ACS0TY_030980 [Phlomoides rotata]